MASLCYCHVLAFIILLITSCCDDNNTTITCDIINEPMDIVHNEIFGKETSIQTKKIVPLTMISCRESHLPKDIIKMLDLTDPGLTRSRIVDHENFIPCLNTNKDCDKWASERECYINPLFMLEHCAKSCNTCNKQSQEFRAKHCKNTWYSEEQCQRWASEGECINNVPFMREQCSRACNYCDFEVRCKPYDYHPSIWNIADLPQPDMYNKIFFNQIYFNKYLRYNAIFFILNSNFFRNMFGKLFSLFLKKYRQMEVRHKVIII